MVLEDVSSPPDMTMQMLVPGAGGLLLFCRRSWGSLGSLCR